MKNRSTLIWVTIVLIGIILIAILYFNSKKSIDWTEHYIGKSKDPYGEYLLQELIKDKYHHKISIINKSLNTVLPVSDDSVNTNYLFIGDHFYLNPNDEKTFFSFIEKGNTAFIAANSFPYPISYILKNGGVYIYDSTNVSKDSVEIYQQTDTLNDSMEPDSTMNYDTTTSYEEESYDSSYKIEAPLVSKSVIYSDSTILKTESFASKKINIQFNSPIADPSINYIFDSPIKKLWNQYFPYTWTSMDSMSAPDPSCCILSSFKTSDGHIKYNMIGMPYGKGMIYIHTNPIIFTNYFLKTKTGLSHTEHALSILSNEKIYWDEFSKNPLEDSPSNEKRKDYLKYILSVESFKWAWYLMIGATLLFIILKSKRKYSIMPVLEPVSNTSIEYINTTGRLYMQIGNHRKLIQLNMRLFISFIQQKYGILIKPEDSQSVQWIAAKSGIEEQLYNELFADYKKLTLPGYSVTSKDLHRFYIHMQFIYQKINS
jgi:hypothetical protein